MNDIEKILNPEEYKKYQKEIRNIRRCKIPAFQKFILSGYNVPDSIKLTDEAFELSKYTPMPIEQCASSIINVLCAFDRGYKAGEILAEKFENAN